MPHGAVPSMHSFRHTVASRALLAGESVDEVAFLLGHRDANVTRAVYVRELSDARRRTMRRSRMVAEFGDVLGAHERRVTSQAPGPRGLRASIPLGTIDPCRGHRRSASCSRGRRTPTASTRSSSTTR